ncbi:LysR family transcriptional regulator [Streptomyces montanisoli]|uniref:LysR family transcriptional regulator n=1 Tax=Streptomyces montanisoli TaxID=2798581 RepID=A0A940S160_9ACTN|nr:LysR family transcriptional regulator [Streptomyces montanisoli]MBP0462008.1 LysR family transcriptional regulator [Streptomyces montanisoli]
MFEVRRLRLLRELAAHGTIAAAAEACALTPSAVSQQLALLEREARTTLFIRDGRRLLLTEAAHVLVAHTEIILAQMERARAEVSALEQGVRGTVRLGAFPSAAGAIAAPAIAACQAYHPDLNVELGEQEPEQSLVELRARRIDVALVYEYNLLPRLPHAGIELRPVIREPVLLALPPRHPHAADEGARPLAALRDEHWVAPRRDDSLRTVLERACEAAGFNPRFDFTSDDYSVVLALVQAGLGVSLVPRLVVEQLAADVTLRPVEDLKITRTVSIAIRAGSGGDPAINALVLALRRAARQD